MKTIKAVLLIAGLLALAACEKYPVEGLQGSWRPVYANGSFENSVYVYTYNAPVDESGRVPYVYVGKTNPDVKYEGYMMVPCLRFFKEKGEDVYTSFFKDGSGEESDEPLHYYIKNGKLYREYPWKYLVNDDYYYPGAESDKYYEAPILFLDNGQVKIGDITYERY